MEYPFEEVSAVGNVLTNFVEGLTFDVVVTT